MLKLQVPIRDKSRETEVIVLQSVDPDAGVLFAGPVGSCIERLCLAPVQIGTGLCHDFRVIFLGPGTICKALSPLTVLRLLSDGPWPSRDRSISRYGGEQGKVSQIACELRPDDSTRLVPRSYC